jgi:hypothetical protein
VLHLFETRLFVDELAKTAANTLEGCMNLLVAGLTGIGGLNGSDYHKLQ